MANNRADQVTVANALRDLLNRVRILEATQSQGIEFGGADPVYGPYNFGDWLYARTTGGFDLDLVPDPLAVGGTWGMVFEDEGNSGDSGALFGSVLNVLIKSEASDVALQAAQAIDLLALAGALTIDGRGAGGITITTAAGAAGGDLTAKIARVLGVGRFFTVTDHLGAPKLQWQEGTLDFHIPTGGVIVADL